MKRFTVPCDFNGVKHPFHVYIGDPNPKKHPLQFQSWWLSSERGGNILILVIDRAGDTAGASRELEGAAVQHRLTKQKTGAHHAP